MIAPIIGGLVIVLAAALLVQGIAWLFAWWDRRCAAWRSQAHRESLDRIGRDRYAMVRVPGESDHAFRRRMVEYGRPVAITLGDLARIGMSVPGVRRCWAIETGERGGVPEVTVYVNPDDDEAVAGVVRRLGDAAPAGIRYRVVGVRRVA